MVETKDVVIAIFGATSASSGLVLVFIGIIAQTLWTGNLGIPRKQKFKNAAFVSSLAFLIGLVCAGLSTWWLVLHQPDKIYIALIAAFLSQLVLIGIAGGQIVCQAIFKLT
jgi:hypothetical protein